MSVSALTNSFYNYVPATSYKIETSNTNNTNDTQENNIKVVDEKYNKIVYTTNNYNKNIENTLNNNYNNIPSYLTGEEILSARPDKNNSTNQQLTEEEQAQVEELKARDREVKNHEQAHIAAGGSYVKGGANYDYQKGPDGIQYAVSGSVNIDTSPIANDPEATIKKAQTVIKAALAPTEPSGQDQKVAASARKMMNEARQELNNQQNKIDDENIDEKNNTSLQQKNDKNLLNYNIGSLISITA